MLAKSNVAYKVKNSLEYRGITVTVQTDGYAIYWSLRYKDRECAASYDADAYSAGEVSAFAKDFIDELLTEKETA